MYISLRYTHSPPKSGLRQAVVVLGAGAVIGIFCAANGLGAAMLRAFYNVQTAPNSTL